MRRGSVIVIGLRCWAMRGLWVLALPVLAGVPAATAEEPPPASPDPAEAEAPAFPDIDEFRQTGAFPEEQSDADLDGVPDIDDNCPVTPAETFTEIGTVRTQVDECGCPRDPCQCDGDNDGVPDCRDHCPDTRFGDLVDARGCTLPVVEPWREQIQVRFDFDSHQIKPEFESLLVEIRKRLESSPNLVVTLEGHTDWKGRQPYNQPLSERRAEACREFVLRDSALAPERVRTRGFGELHPLGDNGSEEGRARNRRVEALFEDVRRPEPAAGPEPEVPAP